MKCRSCGRPGPCATCEAPVQGPLRAPDGPCHDCRPSRGLPPCFGSTGACAGDYTSSDAFEALEAHTRHAPR